MRKLSLLDFWYKNDDLVIDYRIFKLFTLISSFLTFMRYDFEDCILCSVYQALFQGMTLMMQPLNIWSFTLTLQAYTRNFPLPQLDSSAFTFRSCLPSGWTVLLFSGVTTLISERVFLDHNNFWPTFLVHFSIGFTCFGTSSAVMWVASCVT